MSNYHQFKDGSVILRSVNHRGKWVAISRDGGLLLDPDTRRTRHFDTEEEAKGALLERGEAEGG